MLPLALVQRQTAAALHRHPRSHGRRPSQEALLSAERVTKARQRSSMMKKGTKTQLVARIASRTEMQ